MIIIIISITEHFLRHIIFHPVAQVNDNMFHFHFTQIQLIFKVLSNEHVTCNFKVAPSFECPLTISANRMKKKGGMGEANMYRFTR